MHLMIKLSPVINWKRKTVIVGLLKTKLDFLYQQYWLVFGSFYFIKMSKGWNETLIFEHSSLSLDWYLLYCMRFEENPPASELSPLYKAFVRDVLFNVNWNKNMCWQTGHHPSAAGPTMHSCPRRLKMSILLVSAVQRFFMWGSSDICWAE